MTMDVNEFALKFGAIVSGPRVSPETALADGGRRVPRLRIFNMERSHS